MKSLKKETIFKGVTYLIFAGILLYMRLPVGYLSDDAAVSTIVNEQTLWENFVIHWEENGRIFTDVFANMFYRMPFIIWKLFDTLVYCIIATLISKIFTKDTWKDLAISCALILLFPFWYMASAGYVASSANYIYTILCLLGIMYHLTLVHNERQVPKVLYVTSPVCILYATNHDQTAMVLLGGLLLYLIFCVVTKVKKQILQNTVLFFGASIASYAFMFLMPGHIARMSSTIEIEYWLPDYVNWTLFEKIYFGFTSTMATLLFLDVKLFTLLCFMILLIALRQTAIHKKIIGAIPILIIFFSNYIGVDKFIAYYDHTLDLPELIPYSVSLLPILCALLAVISIFYTVITCIDHLERKCLLVMLLILAAGSREMMGFSPTIYASSFRTFTFFLFATIACILVLLNELKDSDATNNNEKSTSLWYVAIGALAFITIY